MYYYKYEKNIRCYIEQNTTDMAVETSTLIGGNTQIRVLSLDRGIFVPRSG